LSDQDFLVTSDHVCSRFTLTKLWPPQDPDGRVRPRVATLGLIRTRFDALGLASPGQAARIAGYRNGSCFAPNARKTIDGASTSSISLPPAAGPKRICWHGAKAKICLGLSIVVNPL
jgi:hypothetical protein